MKKLGIFKYEYVGERAIQSGFPELVKYIRVEEWRIDCNWSTSGNGKDSVWNIYDTKHRYS